MLRRWCAVLVAATGVLVLATRAHAAGPDDLNLDRPLVVLTAAPPLDAERLADALRTYLDEFRVDVRTAGAVPSGDLRAELAASEGIGAAARAWAVVRIADGAPGSAEIELVDRVTGKSLVTSVPRPQRDQDLYRSVALKVQALLRASLTEPTPRAASSPTLARLARADVAAPVPEHRFGLETSFAAVGFSSGRVHQQGLAVALTRRFGERFELALGAAALSGIDAQAGAVSATVDRVPVYLAARLTEGGARWQALAGLVGETAFVQIETASPTLAVRSGWSVAPAFGGQAGARLRLGGRAWLGATVTALGVVIGQHFTAQGQPLVSLSGLQVGAAAGVGVELW